MDQRISNLYQIPENYLYLEEIQFGQEQVEGNDNHYSAQPLDFFLSSLAKTISPVSGHLVQTPLGTPSLDLTLTVEFWFIKESHIYLLLSVSQCSDAYLIKALVFKDLRT